MENSAVETDLKGKDVDPIRQRLNLPDKSGPSSLQEGQVDQVTSRKDARSVGEMGWGEQ